MRGWQSRHCVAKVEQVVVVDRSGASGVLGQLEWQMPAFSSSAAVQQLGDDTILRVFDHPHCTRRAMKPVGELHRLVAAPHGDVARAHLDIPTRRTSGLHDSHQCPIGGARRFLRTTTIKHTRNGPGRSPSRRMARSRDGATVAARCPGGAHGRSEANGCWKPGPSASVGDRRTDLSGLRPRAEGTVRITEEAIDRLHEHATISTAFVVERILAATQSDCVGGVTFSEVAVDHPWVKDYDAIEPPTNWLRRFDTRDWRLLVAYEARVRVGGAVIIPQTPTKAILWDLRVRPESRSCGVGSALFRAAEDWSRARGCRVLEVETQNVNAPACLFYARMGCRLADVEQEAYPDLPGEARIVWARDLDSN